MNKYKTWGIIAGLSIFLTIFGYWAKITHQSYAESMLKAGMWSLSVCGAVYAYFMFANLTKK